MAGLIKQKTYLAKPSIHANCQMSPQRLAVMERADFKQSSPKPTVSRTGWGGGKRTVIIPYVSLTARLIMPGIFRLDFPAGSIT
jgi:hypothetical protein